MRGRISLAGVLLLLLAAPLLPGATSSAAPAPQHLTFRGVVIAVNRTAHSLSLREDRGAIVALRLVEGTRYQVPGGAEGLVPGLRVEVSAVRREDGALVAVRVRALDREKEDRRAPEARPGSQGGVIAGVVLAAGDRTVSVLTEGNAILTVLLTGITAVSGKPTRLAVVDVVGTRNSDGSVSARALTVRFDPRRAIRVSGRIALVVPNLGFALADRTLVTVGEETWIIRGNVLRPPSVLRPGVKVTVLAEGRTPFVAARVIELAP